MYIQYYKYLVDDLNTKIGRSIEHLLINKTKNNEKT